MLKQTLLCNEGCGMLFLPKCPQSHSMSFVPICWKLMCGPTPIYNQATWRWREPTCQYHEPLLKISVLGFWHKLSSHFGQVHADRRTESDAYEPTVQHAQVGSIKWTKSETVPTCPLGRLTWNDSTGNPRLWHVGLLPTSLHYTDIYGFNTAAKMKPTVSAALQLNLLATWVGTPSM